MLPEPVVVHASALVELLVGTGRGQSVHGRLRGARAHAPAQIDSEVLACLARLDALPVAAAEQIVVRLASMPLLRHPTSALTTVAWARRRPLGPADMLYVALAEQLDAPLVATDLRLAEAYPRAEIVTR